MVGPSCRHGPHQGAQKSTRTGCSLFSTSDCQFSLVNSTTLSLAMSILLEKARHAGPVFSCRESNVLITLRATTVIQWSVLSTPVALAPTFCRSSIPSYYRERNEGKDKG